MNRQGNPKPFLFYEVMEIDQNDHIWYVTPEEASDYLDISYEDAQKLPIKTKNKAVAEALAERLTKNTNLRFQVFEDDSYMNPPTHGRIREEDVPIDDVVWVSNRSNQKEFIVRNRKNRDYTNV